MRQPSRTCKCGSKMRAKLEPIPFAHMIVPGMEKALRTNWYCKSKTCHRVEAGETIYKPTAHERRRKERKLRYYTQEYA